MPKKEARKHFLDLAIPILKQNGFSEEDPAKVSIENKYNECVKAKLASGMTQEQID